MSNRYTYIGALCPNWIRETVKHEMLRKLPILVVKWLAHFCFYCSFYIQKFLSTTIIGRTLRDFWLLCN